MISLEREGPLAVATLSRAPVNAIDEGWLARLEGIFGELQGATVLLLRSGQKAFCAGADLELMRSRFDSAEGRSRMVAFVREIQRVFERLERLPQVTLAEIGGPALGGGLELALACDLRIAAEDARLGLPEPRLGLIPGAGGTQRLPRIAGVAVAKRLILGAEVISGAQAAALGVVHGQAGGRAGGARPPDCARHRVAAGRGARRGESLHRRAERLRARARRDRRLLAQDETQRRVRAFLKSGARRAGQAALRRA